MNQRGERASEQQGVILHVEGLVKHFRVGRSLAFSKRAQAEQLVRAVDGVSFDLQQGEVLALVGESGSGKTTIARTLIGLEEPTGGDIRFNGQQVRRGKRTRSQNFSSNDPFITLRDLRRKAQMIFQDPYEFAQSKSDDLRDRDRAARGPPAGARDTRTGRAGRGGIGRRRFAPGRGLFPALSARAIGWTAPTGGDRSGDGAAARVAACR